MTSFLIWWHRVVLRHHQTPVLNGPTEAGVWCECPGMPMASHPKLLGSTWFPSDGGHGR